MKLNKTIGIVTCMMLIFFAISFKNTKAIQLDSGERTLGEIQEEVENYLKNTHPEIKVGTQSYVEYLTEQLMTTADNELACRNDYEDICKYAVEYLSLVDRKQCVYLDEKQILNLSVEEKNMTLKEVDIAAEEERKMEHSFVNQYAVQVVSSSYNASDAVSYARKWAKDRNTAYNSYTSDCTNFVSQAAHAGGISMKKPNTIKHGITTTTSYWYSKKHKFTGTTGQASYEFDVSTSWIRVGDFYKYAISHGATAPHIIL